MPVSQTDITLYSYKLVAKYGYFFLKAFVVKTQCILSSTEASIRHIWLYAVAPSFLWDFFFCLDDLPVRAICFKVSPCVQDTTLLKYISVISCVGFCFESDLFEHKEERGNYVQFLH